MVLTVLIWGFGFFVFWPFRSYFVQKLTVYEDVIVSNYSLHLWLMTPRGALWLLLMGSTTLLSWTIYAAGVFLVLNRSEGNGLRDGIHVFLREGLGRAKGLLQLSLLSFVVLLPMIIPAAAGPIVGYLLFLRHHDINYYLTQQPPEFQIAIAIAIGWLLLWAYFFLHIVIRLIFVYPCWLAGSESFRGAFRESWRMTRDIHTRLLRLLFQGIVLWWLLAIAIQAVTYFMTAAFLHLFAKSLNFAVFFLSGHLVFSWGVHAVFFFCATAWAASAVYICYCHAHPTEDASHVQNIECDFSSLEWNKIIRYTLLLLVFVNVASWGVSIWIFKQNVSDSMPKVVAHRAAAEKVPENSLTGLQKVLANNSADKVEIDVQLTADGIVVVAHDKDLMKVAQNRMVIAKSTFKELKSVDIGKRVLPEFAGEHIPLLADFLELCKDRLPLLIEFKYASGTDLVDKTIRLIKKYEMEDQVVLLSLNLTDVRRAQKLAPEIKNGYFVSVEVGNLRNLDVDLLAIKDGLESQKLIDALHKRGAELYVWTVDNPQRMIELAAMGVDGLITDEPELCADVLQGYSELPSEQRMMLRFNSFWHILRELDIWDE